MPIVITNCTSRKTSRDDIGPSTSDLRTGTLNEVAREWRKKLTTTRSQHPANTVYCGRGFREVEAASKSLPAELYIISAGLGVIHSTTKIPCYNLTVATGTPVSIKDKVTPPYTPQAWWKAVTSDNPFGQTLKDLLAKNTNELILLALSRPYVGLVFDELEALTASNRENLRFFGKNTKSALPPILQDNWMPYDDRLQALGKGYSGTQSDFAQRALKHFVHIILPTKPNASALEHGQYISQHFLMIKSYEKCERRKLDDDMIARLMHQHSRGGMLTTTALLKVFRHNLGIACEQSRFRKIYELVQNEYQR